MEAATLAWSMPDLRAMSADFADALHHAGSRACEAFVTFDAKGFAGRAKRLALAPPVRLLV